mgnify:CR=1 FL=1
MTKWLPAPRLRDPDDIDPKPIWSRDMLARADTIPRFAEPTEEDFDYSGLSVTVSLDDIEFAGGLGMIREAEVEAEGDSTGGYSIRRLVVLPWRGSAEIRRDWARLYSGEIYDAVCKAAEPMILEKLAAEKSLAD